MTPAPELLIADEWLASVLKRPVYRLALGPAHHHEAALAQLRNALAPLQAMGAFVYTKVPVSAIALVRVVQPFGFFVVDTNVILDKPISQPAPTPRPGYVIRCTVPADQAEVVEVARTSFVWSRFHQDPLMPAGVANTIKAEWVANYYRGLRGQQMVVAEAGGQVVGFLQLLEAGTDDWVIDLIAVAAAHRGKGLASAMINYGETLTARGRYVVGTQVANTQSMRLYEGLGFRVCGASHVLHGHFGA